MRGRKSKDAQPACDHTPGFNEGYIYNCPFCGAMNEKLEGKPALVYSQLQRNGVQR